jgi:thymidylate synthase
MFEDDYKDLIDRILMHGTTSSNRTGIDTMKLFNQNLNIDLRRGFPILTGKMIDFNKAYHEWKWIMDGGTTIKYLNKHGIHWWDQFADSRGRLGKIYGHQLRLFNGEFDQLDYVMKEIKEGSRRAVISLWNPSELKEQSLPCCYTTIIFMREGDSLNMHITFISSDVFLGLPYDIIFGALMLIHVAGFCEVKPAMLGLTLVDAHVYKNHVQPIEEYFKAKTFNLPTYSKVSKTLLGYKHSPFIKAELNV